jgi:hypothetical protein
VIKNYIKYFIKKILNADDENWCIGMFYDDISFSGLKKIKIFKKPEDEFWADPFLVKHKKKKYVFFEKFKKKQNKGILSVGEIENEKLVNIKDILIKDYHLSYPFVFKRGSSYYLIPETHQNKRLEIYKAKKFPYVWKLYSTAFNGELVADPTVFLYNKKLWLFINKTKKKLSNLNKDLYIYQIDSLRLKKIIAHKKNPVISKFIGGRNAGNIFESNGKIYRPSQINKYKKYGYGLQISEITKLNINTYFEKKAKIILPNFLKNLKGTHHLSKRGRLSIIDMNFKRINSEESI